ncbi:uncharacterized protein L969DRAFT_51025 [Mixia osmundae IAM 14324]|uniref:Uncharacterized protein n=1 Tax=Mixia osmundae (strain CBS 9802 / IAM 14324 / JCM 22182 / KY 12970) TaxID=764103 RepID=G7E7P5_MIXOS|nr:uncharacterized protein L969DRAFT_51025 [Mixia osmundae IAM 14324]KEI38455.1 hypothetical protein L969DRAFT_51025 [Mixia osmundae IAM 14324]GAA98855.1 hypothetical protein E5Q_05543 [Mixia osmundae IAM 14324]
MLDYRLKTRYLRRSTSKAQYVSHDAFLAALLAMRSSAPFRAFHPDATVRFSWASRSIAPTENIAAPVR